MVTPPIQFASLGMADSLILMVLALVVFGPRRLPQIGRQIGKLMYEFRKASNDFKFQMEEELRNAEESDRRKQEEERLRAMALAPPGPPAEPGPEPAVTVLDPNPEPGSESPYPSQSQYPELDTPAPQTAPIEGASPEPLNVQPPTTGEVVSALPPYRTGALMKDYLDATAVPTHEPVLDGDLPVGADSSTAPAEPNPTSEQAARHG